VSILIDRASRARSMRGDSCRDERRFNADASHYGESRRSAQVVISVLARTARTLSWTLPCVIYSAVTGSITVRETAGFKVGPGESRREHCGYPTCARRCFNLRGIPRSFCRDGPFATVPLPLSAAELSFYDVRKTIALYRLRYRRRIVIQSRRIIRRASTNSSIPQFETETSESIDFPDYFWFSCGFYN